MLVLDLALYAIVLTSILVGHCSAGESLLSEVSAASRVGRRLQFDVASPIFHAIGSVASYSINKLVIDPHREREVYKVWKELQASEEQEAREQGIAAQSILPEQIKNQNKKQLSTGELQGQRMGMINNAGSTLAPGSQAFREAAAELQGQLQSRNPVNAFSGPQPVARVMINPRMAILASRCNDTGVLSLLFDGFSPQNKIVVYRSILGASYDIDSGPRLPYDPTHNCGGTQLQLKGEVGSKVRTFMATQSTQKGAALIEATLRDTRMCQRFAYQALDVGSCRTSNVVILSKASNAMSPISEIKIQSSDPYTYARELELP